MSLMVETWTTTNRVAILGNMIHWIDDMLNLHERVLVVKELCESHRGAHMAKVLHEMLVDYNLTNKIRIFFIFVYFFVLNLFFLILYSYARSLLIMETTIGL